MLSAVDVATSAARLALAAVFALAAGAKVLDPAGTRRALGEFGVRARAARVLAWVVPAVEGLAAAGLLINPTALVAAALAAALMLAFSVAIGRILRDGRRPDCNCFGQLQSTPIGWRVLARNALVGLAAIFVAATGPGDPIPPWLIAVALAAIATSLARIARRPRSVSRVGESAPPVVGLDRALRDGLPTAVVFVSPDCGPCRALIPELARWRSAMDGRLTLLTVDAGASEFGVTATPSALIVAPDGRIASGTATGVAGVEALVRLQLATL
jgi:thiol-disulfide isomerase/thioredoxin/uncharacterized membrane protein YphA (DoxX/SURF4 family)